MGRMVIIRWTLHRPCITRAGEASFPHAPIRRAQPASHVVGDAVEFAVKAADFRVGRIPPEARRHQGHLRERGTGLVAVVDLQDTPLPLGFDEGRAVQSRGVEQDARAGAASERHAAALGKLGGRVQNFAAGGFRADREMVVALADIGEVVDDLRVVQVQRML